jgi:hypothetical protein
MLTGKKLGFKKGDFVFTGAFPGIIISNVNTSTPCCEVWGIEQEMGSAYASEMRKLSPVEFAEMVKAHGYSLPLSAYAEESKKALKALAEGR